MIDKTTKAQPQPASAAAQPASAQQSKAPLRGSSTQVKHIAASNFIAGHARVNWATVCFNPQKQLF